MSNPINPQHYNRLEPQPKDVIRAWDLNFNLGNAVKYISRAGHKDDIIQDLKKARQYLDFEIEHLEQERIKEFTESLNHERVTFKRINPETLHGRIYGGRV